MEDNFNQNDFEAFLKEQVRNHRMYPNDSVWREINKKLHGDKKWPALTIAAFMLLSATITICVYFTPKPDIFAVNASNNNLNSSDKSGNSSLLNSQHTTGLNNLSASSSLYKTKELSYNGDETKSTASAISPVVSNDISDKVINPIVSQTKQSLASKGTANKNDIALQNGKIADNEFNQKLNDKSLELNSEKEYSNDIDNSNLTIVPKKVINSAIKPLTDQTKNTKDYNDKNIVDNFLRDHQDEISVHSVPKIKSAKNKFGFQLYIAPSISYRKLLEDKSILKEGANPGPVGLNYVADVNKVVRHKPGNGLEAGVSIFYNLTDNFRIKSGLQFNVRQYNIEAYRSSTEISSIALIENNRIDTVTSLAIYRNSNGYYPAELVNRYYQIAVPVGVEWQFAGNKRIQLNIAGTIQPTYLINHNAYLLSTNFKNYSENPSLVRSFNINSNIETYISFKVGDFKWQVGPQIRYQPYSTFIPQYPIKEHLLDYGIKFGFSKTF